MPRAVFRALAALFQSENSASLGERLYYGGFSCRRWGVAAALGLLVLMANLSRAHAETEVRLEGEAKLNPVGKLQVVPSVQARLNPSPLSTESFLSGLELGYRLLPQLSFAVGYRLNYDRNSDDDWRFKHRVHLDAGTKWRWKAWSAKWRGRIQDERRTTRRGNVRHRPTVRNAVYLKWEATRQVAPFAMVEHFLALEKLQSTQTRKWRSGFGAEWVVGAVELQGSYRYDAAVAVEEEESAHIISLGVSY